VEQFIGMKVKFKKLYVAEAVYKGILNILLFGKMVKGNYSTTDFPFSFVSHFFRPTWELRDSFTSKKLFDEFDRKALKKATSWAPIFNAEQNFIKHKYAIRKKNRKNVKTEEPSPSDVTGCIDVNGTKFAVVSFYKSPSQLIRWDIFKNDHPELAKKFIESRCLKDILN
jgi:hypothetical protein